MPGGAPILWHNRDMEETRNAKKTASLLFPLAFAGIVVLCFGIAYYTAAQVSGAVFSGTGEVADIDTQGRIGVVFNGSSSGIPEGGSGKIVRIDIGEARVERLNSAGEKFAVSADSLVLFDRVSVGGRTTKEGEMKADTVLAHQNDAVLHVFVRGADLSSGRLFVSVPESAKAVFEGDDIYFDENTAFFSGGSAVVPGDGLDIASKTAIIKLSGIRAERPYAQRVMIIN